MKSNNAGFTLVELLTTLAVAAIVLTAGVPSFRELIQNNRLATATNELVATLHLARSEAIKRNARVTVCKSVNGTSCATSGDWSQGWLVFTDPNSNAAYDSSTETLLHVQRRFSGASVTGEGDLADYVSYLGSGHSKLTSGAMQSGTILICDARGNKAARAVLGSGVGHIRLANDSNGDGIVEDASGTNVSCP
jgi:type IV fimbrial biogenesis protein FimT